jgi:hypothetical protein
MTVHCIHPHPIPLPSRAAQALAPREGEGAVIPDTIRLLPIAYTAFSQQDHISPRIGRTSPGPPPEVEGLDKN